MKLIHKLQSILESVEDVQDRLTKLPDFIALVRTTIKNTNRNNVDNLPVENFFKVWKQHEKTIKPLSVSIFNMTNDDVKKAESVIKKFLKGYKKFKESRDYTEYVNFISSEKMIGSEFSKKSKRVLSRLDGIYSRLLDLLKA